MASDYEDRVPNLGEEETPDASPSTNRKRFWILGTVVVLSLAYMIYAAFPGNALYFLTVDEFMERDIAQDGRIVRISGKLVDGSFLREDQSTVSHFRLSDEGASLDGQYLRASYNGILPDLFFNPHSEIILQGSYGTDEVFQADDILVKCPSKYQSLEEELGSSS